MSPTPLLVVSRSPEQTEATSVSLSFESAAAVSFMCQLDTQGWSNCTSPYKVSLLGAGVHTFTLYAYYSPVGSMVVNHTWEVAPRITFEGSPQDVTLVMGATRNQHLPVQSTVDGVFISASDVRIVLIECVGEQGENQTEDGSSEDTGGSSSSSLYAHGSIRSDGLVEIVLDASAVNVSTTSSIDYTVRVIVEDSLAAGYESMLVASFAVHVTQKAALLLLPTSGLVTVRSGQKSDVVVAGQEALLSDPWVVNLGLNGTNGEEGCASPALSFDISPKENQTWVIIEPSSASLANIGDSLRLRVTLADKFRTAVSSMQLATFFMSNSLDGSIQELQISMTIVADVISNKSTVTKAAGADGDADTPLQTGGAAQWLLTPLDQFSNLVAEGKDQFWVDVFRTESEPATKKELEGQPVAQFNSSSLSYSSHVDTISVYGAYEVYIRLAVSDLDYTELAQWPGANWTDPQGYSLQGSPLQYYFSPVVCDANQHQTADQDGLNCACQAGYYNTLASSAAQGVLACEACGYGRYGPTATTESREAACLLCEFDGRTDSLTTIVPDASQEEQCGCAPGHYHNAPAASLLSCSPCPPGQYEDTFNSSACQLCPVGTRNALEGATEVCSEVCVRTQVAAEEGQSECWSCASNSHATYACLINGTWHMDGLGYCLEHAAETLVGECTCDDGFYQTTSDGLVNKTCASCPEGAECRYGKIRGLPGYWRDGFNRTQLYECSPTDVCLGEAALSSRDASLTFNQSAVWVEESLDDGELSVCEVGHDGVLCGACIRGWVLEPGDGLCHECDTKDQNVQVTALAWLPVVLSMLLIAAGWLQRPFYHDAERQLKSLAASVAREARSRSAARMQSLLKANLNLALAVTQAVRRRGTNSPGVGQDQQDDSEWPNVPGNKHELDAALAQRSSRASVPEDPSPQDAAHGAPVSEDWSDGDCHRMDERWTGAVDSDGNADAAAVGEKSEETDGDGRNHDAPPTPTGTGWQQRPGSECSTAGSTYARVSSSRDEILTKRMAATVLKADYVDGTAVTRTDGGNTDASEEAAGASSTGSEGVNSDTTTDVQQLISILFSFSQVLGSFSVVYDVSWPQPFRGFTQFLMVFNFRISNVPTLASIRCSLAHMDFFQIHTLCIAVPFAIIVCLFTLAAISYFIRWRRAHLRPLSVTAGFYKYFCIRTVFFLLYVSYIAVSSRMLSYFHCIAVYDDYFLEVDLHVQCWVGKHREYLPLAILGVVLYPVGLPALFACLLIWYRVPQLARIKRRAWLLHLACEKLDPTRSTTMEHLDPLLNLQKVTVEELSSLACRAGLLRPHEEALLQMKDAMASNIGSGSFRNATGQTGFSDGPQRCLRDVKTEQQDGHTCANSQEMSDSGNAFDAVTAASVDDGGSRKGSSGGEREVLIGGEREVLIDQLVRWFAARHGDVRFSVWISWTQISDLDSQRLLSDTSSSLMSRWSRSEMRALMRAGFIFKAYHVEIWWYEIVDLMRKLLLTSVLLYLQEHRLAQLVLGASICFVTISLNLCLHPETSHVVHVFTTITLMQLYYSLLLGIVLVCQEEENEHSHELIGHLLLWPALMVYAVFFMFVGWQLCSKTARGGSGDHSAKNMNSLAVRRNLHHASYPYTGQLKECKPNVPPNLQPSPTIMSDSVGANGNAFRMNPIFNTQLNNPKLAMQHSARYRNST
ncbi:hypothetical protein CYMTET_53938 [Cymbomonas tetramitiformis]|uniref:Tyrosine-protein kinase ephrin type A/B receptor-like domain-containing protein n=1 Tax=Cymbomonas tetramitiformis TaxID=36881 RepID=A0AAE0BHF0_9CHLO|nr:hypothetical protein CYMTET_53938 [Cymbomonas tetramitiformis]